MNKNILEKDYFQFLANLKGCLGSSRCKAMVGANHELILLYHHIGTEILKSQEVHGWGSKIIDKLNQDLKSEFPEMKGFGLRNLKYMRKFAVEYPETQFVQQVVAQIPWGHNIFLMELLPVKEDRLFFIKKTIELGWSRSTMAMQIEIARYNQRIDSQTYSQPTQLTLSKEICKDPFISDFLNLEKAAHELFED